jgi:carbon monoxide dehydrogenase subunit G
MAIKIEKTFQVQEPVDRVWIFLSDTRKVASCVPGAQITEAIDDRTFKGLIKVQVGPSVTDYKGQVHIERMDDQTHEIEMVGKGQDVRGKGSASMKMMGKVRSLPDGGSEVVTVSEVNVVGLLAQLGARMINEVSNIMFERFTANLRHKLEKERSPQGEATSAPSQEKGSESQPIRALPLVASVIGEEIARSVKQIFGGPKRP